MFFNSKTRNLYEFYAQYEMRRSTGWLTSKKWSNLLSIELRNRYKYTYPIFKYNTELGSWQFKTSEDRRSWNVNMYFGWRINTDHSYLLNRLGLFLHGYYGIVPYGQYRNVPNYLYGGFSIVMYQ